MLSLSGKSEARREDPRLSSVFGPCRWCHGGFVLRSGLDLGPHPAAVLQAAVTPWTCAHFPCLVRALQALALTWVCGTVWELWLGEPVPYLSTCGPAPCSPAQPA